MHHGAWPAAKLQQRCRWHRTNATGQLACGQWTRHIVLVKAPSTNATGACCSSGAASTRPGTLCPDLWSSKATGTMCQGPAALQPVDGALHQHPAAPLCRELKPCTKRQVPASQKGLIDGAMPCTICYCRCLVQGTGTLQAHMSGT